MPVDKRDQLFAEIIEMLESYSGRSGIEPAQWLNRDLRLRGGDSVQLADDLEARYRLDLEPLIRQHTKFLPPTWLDRLRGRTHGRPLTDMTVRDLVEYISRNKQIE